MDEQKYRTLENRIVALENQSRGGVDRNIGALDKKVIEDTISDAVFNIVWDKYFYYSTFFDSLDGWRVDVGGTGATSITDTHIKIATGTTSGSSAYAQKNPVDQQVLRWDKESRFRTEFDMFSNTNQEIRISIGDSSNGVTDSHYGFWVDDGNLYGTASLDTTTQTVLLQNVVGAVVYSLEARYYPGSKVVFYVDGVEKGSLTDVTKLPSMESTLTFATLFTFYIENQATEGKFAQLSFVEYIQKR